jgi:aminoglycoside phosphotransferase
MFGAGFEFPRRPPFDRARTPITATEIAQLNMPRCFRCQGIGHVASACANPADTVITTAAALEVLSKVPVRAAKPARRPSTAASSAAARRRPSARVNFIDGDDADNEYEGETEEAFLARLEETQILGEDDPHDDPFGDSEAFVMGEAAAFVTSE